MKRTERLRMMLEKELWKEGDNVYRLPKIKTVRIRIKKEKAAEKVETAAAPAEGATSAAGETKEQPATKAPASGPKGQDKK